LRRLLTADPIRGIIPVRLGFRARWEAPSGTLILGKPECAARVGGQDVSMVSTDGGQVANKAIEVGLGVALDAALEAIQRQYPGAKLIVRVRE